MPLCDVAREFSQWVGTGSDPDAPLVQSFPALIEAVQPIGLAAVMWLAGDIPLVQVHECLVVCMRRARACARGKLRQD
eukprot:6467161-Pyramimonas_sp.AAC.1